MRDCKLIRESLSGWLDGQLSTSDAEIIRLHLESCAPCDGERHQLEKLQSSLESLLVSNVPRIAFEPFWAGVRERITKKRGWHEEVMEWARSTFAAPGFAWTVPAVIVVLLGVFALDSFWKLRSQRNNLRPSNLLTRTDGTLRCCVRTKQNNCHLVVSKSRR
jgi:predicted anti-sigma-YlaC factor YlaD